MRGPGDDVFAPGFGARPWWWEAASPSAGEPAPLPEAADVVVIGAGYAGLSAALELARRGTRVVALDSAEPGFGASSRNGGMVGGALKVSPAALIRALGEAEATALIEEGDRAFDHIEALIAREGIECHYRRGGRFVAAHAPSHYAALAQRAETLRRMLPGAFDMVPRERQGEEIGSAAYHGGMVVERAGGLHPALYHRGLAAAARRAGAAVHGRAAVRAVRRDARGFVVETERGSIDAREVVVATNGYTTAVTPQFRRRLIPVASYIIATEELPEELARALIPKGRMIADTRNVLYYFRLSPDGRRLLFGGRASFAETDERTAASRLHGFMCGVYPQLRDVRVTHAWKGNVAFTFDMLPHMGVQDGVHYAMGCNGSGVAMATHLGHQVALKIAGGANRRCAFDGRPFPTRAFYDGRPWFLPLVGAWYRLCDALAR